MKSFTEGPLRIVLAIFATFGMLRSLLALIEAVTTEPARMITAMLYLLLIICTFAGAYLLFSPGPSGSEETDDAAIKNEIPTWVAKLEKTYNARLAG